MADRYWVGGTATWDATAGSKWSTTSGGAGGASVPTSADNVFFTNLSTGTCTTSSSSVCADLDFTGFTGGLTIPASTTLQVYGSLTFVAGMTFTVTAASSSITYKATATGKTITTNGKLQPKWVFDGTGGGWTLQDNLTWVASVGIPTLTLTAGALDTNGKAVNYTSGSGGSWSITGTSTRSLTLGTSTISMLSGNWDATDTTNLTFSGASSTIELKGTTVNQSFIGGGLTYGTLSITSLTSGIDTITGANTFTTLSFSATITTGYIMFGANQTCTTIQTTGGTLTGRYFFRSDTRGTSRTITAGTVSLQYTDLQDITGAGAGSWNLSAITGGSGDCGGNSGITFTTPANQYWVPSGGTSTGNIADATRWATSSGGTAGTGRSPLPQDAAYFDANSIDAGSRTITLNKPRMSSMDWTGITNTPTLSRTTPCEFYGSFTFVAGMVHSGTATWTYCGRSNSTFNCGGNAMTNQIRIDSSDSFALTLASNFETTLASNTGALYVLSGIFNSSTYTTTISGANSSFTITGGTMNINNTLTVSTAPVLTAGTVNLTNTSLVISGAATITGAGTGGGLATNPLGGYIT